MQIERIEPEERWWRLSLTETEATELDEFLGGLCDMLDDNDHPFQPDQIGLINELYAIIGNREE